MPPTNLADEERRATPEPPSTPGETSNTSSMHHTFGDVTSRDDAQQVNGNLCSPNPPSDGPRNHYKVVKAEGHSQQLNGNGSDVELLKVLFAPRCQQEFTATVYSVGADRHG